MMDAVLTLNVGSTSLRAALFDVRTGMNLDRVHFDGPDAFEALENWVAGQNKAEVGHIVATIHRVVHGGAHAAPVVIDDAVVTDLTAFVPFAPLHQPFALDGIARMRAAHPGILHIACFDTAFHAGAHALRTTLALPDSVRAAGIRRYGFHGLSYAGLAKKIHAEKIAAAHLGGGSSVCAIHNGRSVDFSMGMTALDGIPMGTRSGSIDPGVILYLAGQYGTKATQDMLYKDSGLKALSGFTDWKHISENAHTDERAAFAFDYFAAHVAQAIASMAVTLAGVDVIAFTGGIGEHDARLRDAVAGRLSFLHPFRVEVVACDEERTMFEASLPFVEQMHTH